MKSQSLTHSLPTIGIVAPSSVVPQIELKMGLDRIYKAGFPFVVHTQVSKKNTFFAGDDQHRAEAFYDFAVDPAISILWSARGGWGASRILPLLEKLSDARGVPEKKILVGYSDTTALHEFVRSKWDWQTLHAPMPGLREFQEVKKDQWKSLVSWIDGTQGAQSKKEFRVKYLTADHRSAEGELVGGNLTVWSSLMGTPYAPRMQGKVLFLEDTGEYYYRVDRMVRQILLARGFEGVRAIVLGTFSGCKDAVPMVLKAAGAKKMQPLRAEMSDLTALKEIFGRLGESLRIPVVYGLPVGHGNGFHPLPLGGQCRLDSGKLLLLDWTAGSE